MVGPIVKRVSLVLLVVAAGCGGGAPPACDGFCPLEAPQPDQGDALLDLGTARPTDMHRPLDMQHA